MRIAYVLLLASYAADFKGFINHLSLLCCFKYIDMHVYNGTSDRKENRFNDINDPYKAIYKDNKKKKEMNAFSYEKTTEKKALPNENDFRAVPLFQCY